MLKDFDGDLQENGSLGDFARENVDLIAPARSHDSEICSAQYFSLFQLGPTPESYGMSG